MAPREEMRASYQAYFDKLKQEQLVLEELYGPVKRRLTAHTTASSDQYLEFCIRWESLIDYVNRFKTADTVIFMDTDELEVHAVIDYHKLGSEAQQGFLVGRRLPIRGNDETSTRVRHSN